MTSKKRNDSTYRAIVFLMALDIVLGAGIGAMGYALLGSTSIALAGAGLSVCGMVLLLFFELLGRRSL
jgi:predicted MFS family arabinose efflux permease